MVQISGINSPVEVGSLSHYMQARWWQLKYFLFSPRTLGKMNPFWRAYFSDGWEKTTNQQGFSTIPRWWTPDDNEVVEGDMLAIVVGGVSDFWSYLGDKVISISSKQFVNIYCFYIYIYIFFSVYPPPSNSHKWRFRSGFPIKNAIILVVTVTGWGVVPIYIFMFIYLEPKWPLFWLVDIPVPCNIWVVGYSLNFLLTLLTALTIPRVGLLGF